MLPSINLPDRHAEAVPVLTPAQVARIRPYASVRSVQAGEILFEPGTLGMPCFVVLSGRLDIAMLDLFGEHVFVTYGPGQFSGEVVLISGARALSRGRVGEPGEFLELSAEALRTLIARDAELSEIFMRAFLLRRIALITDLVSRVVRIRHAFAMSRLWALVRQVWPRLCMRPPKGWMQS
jgi:thioredoxin reductase (NADPH)